VQSLPKFVSRLPILWVRTSLGISSNTKSTLHVPCRVVQNAKGSSILLQATELDIQGWVELQITSSRECDAGSTVRYMTLFLESGSYRIESSGKYRCLTFGCRLPQSWGEEARDPYPGRLPPHPQLLAPLEKWLGCSWGTHPW